MRTSTLKDCGNWEKVIYSLRTGRDPKKATRQCWHVLARDWFLNDLAKFVDVFRGIAPYAGTPPKGFLVNFLGTLTDSRFRVGFEGDPEHDGGSYVKTRLPIVEDREDWFEAVNWVEAARAADRYVMITLGASYGAQAVGAQRVLAAVNPMPYRLMAVEPISDNMRWTRKHLFDNGIDPDKQWLLQAAITDSNEPVYFPFVRRVRARRIAFLLILARRVQPISTTSLALVLPRKH
jgi:hypothetical protein